ncbi:MAG TPA: hypothetical protein VF068_01570 [Rubrobacter sp.]
MYGMVDLDVSKLHREEIGREVRVNRVSGKRRAVGDYGVIWELKRDFGLLLKLFQAVRNAG